MKREISCGAVIARQTENGREILLIRHVNGGHWAFPKGHMEGNETESETALREIREETGLTVTLDTGFRAVVTYSPKPDTQSDSSSTTMPSTMKQKLLAQHLANEMVAMGIEDAHMDEWGYVYGTIPANCEKKNVVGFIAHMDTAEEVSGANVKARVIENYDGEDIVLNKELGIVTDVENFPILKKFKGKTLIVTDGTTLLGADDKAGVAEIMQAAEDIIKNNLPHGEIHIAFTPDEEIGAGPDKFDVKGFGCDFAYTLDGGELGGLDYENFNGTSADVEITGRSVHPGSAKNKMINASRVAMEFASLLPSREVPENTEGYEGPTSTHRVANVCLRV